MSEILILAAICAPLLLVPAFILSFHQPVDPIFCLDVEIRLQSWEGDSLFAQFQREMLKQIASAYYLPPELLFPAREYVSVRQTLLAHQVDRRCLELLDEALTQRDHR
jgi:hypothetical protein